MAVPRQDWSPFAGCSGLQGPGREELSSWWAAGTRSDMGSSNRSLDLLPQLLAFLLLWWLYSDQGLSSKITTANAAWSSSAPLADLFQPAATMSLLGALWAEQGPSPGCTSPVELVLGSSRASTFSLSFPACKGQVGLTPKRPSRGIFRGFCPQTPCCGLTQQAAERHPAVHSLSPSPVEWGGELEKSKAHRLR